MKEKINSDKNDFENNDSKINNILPLIRLVDVSKFYKSQNNVALGLHTVSTSLYKNEIVAVTGQSGSGKSTFLNVITGIDSYESGNVFFNGEDTSYFDQADNERFRKKNVGFVFQNYNLIDSYTVIQNVMVPLILKGVDKLSAKKRALELIKKVGIYERRNQKSTKLSGGEKQRCVIARALAVDSPILACDEPTGNLDEKTSKEIINLIKEISKDKLVLIVTHDYDEIKDIATRRLRFSDGDLVEDVLIEDTRTESDIVLNISDDNTLSEKSRLMFAIRNSFSTPRKFIFSFFVFLAVTFGVASIYQTLVSNLKTSDDTNSYLLSLDKDRVIAYNDSMRVFNEQEVNALDDSYFVNPMFTNQTYFSSSFPSNTYNSFTNEALYLHIPSSFKLKGELPTKPGEVVLFRSNFEDNTGIDLIGTSSNIELITGQSLNLTVTGVVKTTSLYKNGIYAPYNYNDFLDSSYVKDSGIYFESLGDISYPNKNFKTAIYYDETVNNEYDFDIVYNDTIISNNDLEIVYSNMSIYYFGYKLKINELDKKVRFIKLSEIDTVAPDITYTPLSTVTVYTKKSTVKDVLNSNIFLVQNFSKSKKEVSSKLPSLTVKNDADYSQLSVDDITNKLFNTGYIIVVIFVILVIYFISYFILSMIFRTKNKDYTMLRSLGMDKKSMASSVRFETVILGACSMFVLLIVILISKVIDVVDINIINLFNIFKFNNYMILIGIMFVFSIVLGNRFNRKLFKTTVNESLKKEELNDD